MSALSIVDKTYRKALESSLSRKNDKLKSQFDELFKILFVENPTLKKLMHEDSIKNLENSTTDILYYNGADLIFDKESAESSKENDVYIILLAIIFLKEINFLYKIYKDKKIIQSYDPLTLLTNILDENISNLFHWLQNETPFKEIKPFSEEEFLNADQKNIYNWKKEKNIITPKKILEIRKTLETLAESHKLKNPQDYIDFFIYRLYLETCKQRINKKIDPNLITILNLVFKVIPKLQPNIKENWIEKNTKNFKSSTEPLINKFKSDFNGEIKNKTYLNIFSEKELKNADYRIKFDSIQEKSIISAVLAKKHAKEINNTLKNIYSENPEFFNSFIKLLKNSFVPTFSDPNFLSKLSNK